MKRIILLAVVAVAVTTVSCRKDRTCDCKYSTTISGGGTSFSSTSSTKVTKAKQKKNYFKAYESCYSSTATWVDNGATYTQVSDCTLN